MIDPARIDRMALALVRRSLSLNGMIKGRDYTAEPHPFVIAVRGEERRVGFEEVEAFSPYWQSMAEAALGDMMTGNDEQPEVGVLGTTICNKCHSVFQGKIPIPCPACRQLDEIGALISGWECRPSTFSRPWS